MNRGKKRGSTVISFRLAKPARIVLTVRGPGPGCAYVGQGRIAGRAGLNRFRFDGTVRKRRLDPGTYLLELSWRDGTRLGRTFVTIVDPDAPRARHPRPRCTSLQLVARMRPVSIAVPLLDEPTATVQGTPATPSSPSGGNGQVSKVLGDAAPEIGLPVPRALGDRDSAGWVELVLLSIALASLLALVAMLYESLRRGRPLF